MDDSFKQLFTDNKLVICVDDFGLTYGVNQAVLNLAEAGKINATSVLIDAPNLTEEFIEDALLLKHQAKLSIGLHLNFTELFARVQDEELVAPIEKQIIRSFFPSKERIDRIYNEIERQFFKFEEHFDCYPDYIDGHQHIHMLPGFFEALRQFYTEYRLDQNDIWIRSLNRVNRLNWGKLPGTAKLKTLILRYATKKARSSEYFMRKELLGVYDFKVTEEQYADLFQQWLRRARRYIQETGRGAVIMVHPSLPEAEIAEQISPNEREQVAYDDPIATARVMEYQFLSQLVLD